MSDVLHDIKMKWDLPGCGTSEKLEKAAKTITPALGLESVSNILRRLARNTGMWLEYHGLATILQKRDVPWQIGLNKHMFFFDDSIINAVIILGAGIAIIQSFDLALPLVGIGAFYIGSDHFFKKIERL